MPERLAVGLIAGFLAVALLGPGLWPVDPLATDVAQALLPPQAARPFGTDHLGRDLLARVIHAARLDLGLALVSVGLAAVVGAGLGAVAGWYGGWPDRLTGWAGDVLLAFPIYLLAMALALAFGNGLVVVVLATAMVNLPFFIRLVRVGVARARQSLWVDAARMAGMGEGRILARLVLPGVAPLVVVHGATTLGWAMLNAAGLSFIGVGVRPPTPEWGILIAEGARYLATGQWWLVVFPGAALALGVLAFHLAGDALRDRLA
jgi:peptide/nickel transport system permease protein